jgi:hypothetical protein
MLSVSIEVPSGWRIAATKGVKRIDGRAATSRLQLDHTTTVRIKASALTTTAGNSS